MARMVSRSSAETLWPQGGRTAQSLKEESGPAEGSETKTLLGERPRGPGEAGLGQARLPGPMAKERFLLPHPRQPT